MTVGITNRRRANRRRAGGAILEKHPAAPGRRRGPQAVPHAAASKYPRRHGTVAALLGPVQASTSGVPASASRNGRGSLGPVQASTSFPATEEELAALTAELAGGPTAASRPAHASRRRPSFPFSGRVEHVARAIVGGDDPLGDAFCRLRPPKTRRCQGAIYTPRSIVESMLRWAARQGGPARVVDPGAGSGRFLLAAGRAFPEAKLVAVETHPLRL